MRKSVVDDFEGIAAERERIRREKDLGLISDDTKPGSIAPPCDTEQPRMEDDLSLGYRPIMERVMRIGSYRLAKIVRIGSFPAREPGEFTDGA